MDEESFSIGPEQFPKSKDKRVGKYFFTYQVRDWEIVDYKMWRPVSKCVQFRGPAIDLDKPYVVFLGAAQVFGPYAEKPFPQLLQEKSQVNSLNLGIGGASAGWYLNNKWFNQKRPEKLLEVINKAELCVLQIMSPKNVLLEIDTNLRTVAGSFSSYWQNVEPKEFYNKLKAAKEKWLQDYFELIDKIKIPIYLFDFSHRDFSFKEDLEGFQASFSGGPKTTFIDKVAGFFPQYVDQHMVNQLKKKSDRFYEYKKRVGLPQKLTNRFTGEDHIRNLDMPMILRSDINAQDFDPNRISNFQSYYPSPEMHVGACDVLLQSDFYKDKLNEIS